jgi:hypothetical protein
MALHVKFTDLATGSHRQQPGDVWRAQDGPGRPWWETMVPRRGKWIAIGRDLSHVQVHAIADVVEEAVEGAQSHPEARKAARVALQERGLWEMVEAHP